jgi:hypothetical protein
MLESSMNVTTMGQVADDGSTEMISMKQLRLTTTEQIRLTWRMMEKGFCLVFIDYVGCPR